MFGYSEYHHLWVVAVEAKSAVTLHQKSEPFEDASLENVNALRLIEIAIERTLKN